MTFNYTVGDADVDSSAVYEAYYDAPTSSLAVVLSSGHGYVYSGVPASVYDDLTNGTRSAGRVYATVVKRNYGPGKSLGFVGFDNDDEFVKSVPAPDMGAVGTPKGLTYAAGAKVTTIDPAHRIDLTFTPSPVAPVVTRKHTVKFTVEGGNSVKSYNVDATSVDSAVDKLSEATSALGLNVNVKEVTVYFE